MTGEGRPVDFVDGVARATTAGAPSADFADRVMAPIYGRPRRDFVARVMAGLDVPQGAQAVGRPMALAFRPAITATLALAAVLLAALAILWPSSGALPVAPRAVIAIASLEEPRFAVPDGDRVKQSGRTPSAIAARAVVTTPNVTFAQPRIPVIDALAAPAEIAIDTIEPGPAVVPALAAPSPLTIPRLQISKEKP